MTMTSFHSPSSTISCLQRSPSIHEQEVAVSLVSLFNQEFSVPPSPTMDDAINQQEVPRDIDIEHPSLVEDRPLSRISDSSSGSSIVAQPPTIVSTASSNGVDKPIVVAPPPPTIVSPERKISPRKKRSSTSKRDPRVSFEEMKRVMRVYGPIKCLRNRTPKDSGKITKVLSVKRKFYRWFPDFHERFELQPGNWYKPRIGHEMEMKYRENLRTKDQVFLAAKRVSSKKNSNKINKV